MKIALASAKTVNSVCEGDALGGAAFFENGRVREELPMGREGLLLVEV